LKARSLAWASRMRQATGYRSVRARGGSRIAGYRSVRARGGSRIGDGLVNGVVYHAGSNQIHIVD
jgi:hypothetical protein